MNDTALAQFAQAETIEERWSICHTRLVTALRQAKEEGFDAVLAIRDKSEMYRVALRQANASHEMIAEATELKVRTERLAGEMLREGAKNKDRDPGKGGDRKSRFPERTVISLPTLKEIGITKKQSHRWQKLAAIQSEDFDRLIEEGKSSSLPELTIQGLLRKHRQQKQAKRWEEDQAKAETIAPSDLWTITDDQEVINCAALITDPPYGILNQTWEPPKLEEFTREWAERWNKCGADFCLIFWSQDHLWNGRVWFDESLSNYAFHQLLIWHYANNKKPHNRHQFKHTWEPIFFYRRKGSDKRIVVEGSDWGDDSNDFDCHVAATPQSNFNDVETKRHPAQKPVSVMRWLVGAATRPGDLICDPFTGSGTTGIAALQLKRRFHGIETSAEYRELAEGRIKLYGA